VIKHQVAESLQGRPFTNRDQQTDNTLTHVFN